TRWCSGLAGADGERDSMMADCMRLLIDGGDAARRRPSDTTAMDVVGSSGSGSGGDTVPAQEDRMGVVELRGRDEWTTVKTYCRTSSSSPPSTAPMEQEEM